MAVQKQDDQHEHTFSSYLRVRDVVLKTCLGRWTIGRSGESGSGISVLPARHDDDGDDSLSSFTPVLADGFSVDFYRQKVSIISRTLLSILDDLNNGVVLIVSKYPLIFKSSNPFTTPLVSTKSTNYTWYRHHFHVSQFYLYPCKVQVLIFLFTFSQFSSAVSRDSKVYNSACFFFFVNY